jgi:hypothetical protein
MEMCDRGNSTPLRIGNFVTRIYYNHLLTNVTGCNGNDQKYALILPFLYSIHWLLHVSAVACHHQGAS